MPSSAPNSTKYFLCILLIGTALRFIALPFSDSVVADATSRVFIAWEWMEDPRIITHGGWLPLHFYMMGSALWLWFDPVNTPVYLHLLFSIATAIPLWMFTRNEWGESEALFVSAAYLLYPVSFRYSFMAEVHAPFQFFLAATMYFLSRAIKESKLSHILLAGLSSALASALRYEGWLLIPFFGLMLWRKWNILIPFLFLASIFPVFWMFGNFIHDSNPIGQISAIQDLQARINENLGITEIIRRLLYFPSAIFFGLTPLLSILCIWGVYLVWRERKKQSLWLIPFFGLLIIFIVQGALGYFSTSQTRHSIMHGMLLLPFSAEAFARIKDRKRARNVAILVLLTILPFAYIRVVLFRIAPSFPNPFPADLEPIPKVNEKPKSIARAIRSHFKDRSDGLLIDFFKAEGFYGWKDTNYVGLASRVHPSDLYIFSSSPREGMDKIKIEQILTDHPEGIIVLSKRSQNLVLLETNGQSVINIVGTDHSLPVKPITAVNGITLYRYSRNKFPH